MSLLLYLTDSNRCNQNVRTDHSFGTWDIASTICSILPTVTDGHEMKIVDPVQSVAFI